VNGHVVPRPSAKGKRWQAMVYVDKAHGGPRWKSAGTYRLEREAKAALVKMLDRFLSGTYREPSLLTVAGLYERWRVVQLPEWAANTARHHAMNWEHHIESFLGDEVAETLPKDAVATWQAGLLAAGCAPKSASLYRGTLHAMYEWAISVDLLTANPVAAVPPPRVDRADHDALSPAAMRTYIEALRHTRLWPGLLIASGGGLRRGEFLAVRWRSVTWTVKKLKDDSLHYAGGVHVDAKRGNLTGRIRAELKFGPPKTKGSAGFVPLPSSVLAELAALKEQRQSKWELTSLPWDDEQLVCCGFDGRPIVPDQFTHAFADCCRRNGLPKTHPHAFRHGVIEALLGSGVRPDVVRRIARHSSIATTLGTYAHATEAAAREAMEGYGVALTGAPLEPEKDAAEEARTQLARKNAENDELARYRRSKRPA